MKNPDIVEMLMLASEKLCVDVDLIEWYSWPQTFASTAGPSGGVGGQAMTKFQVFGFDSHEGALLFCAGRWKRWEMRDGFKW